MIAISLVTTPLRELIEFCSRSQYRASETVLVGRDVLTL